MDVKIRHKLIEIEDCVSDMFVIDGVSPSVFRCTSTPMETGPIDACVES